MEKVGRANVLRLAVAKERERKKEYWRHLYSHICVGKRWKEGRKDFSYATRERFFKNSFPS